jgi:aspartokinase-like uncharacterized kinase
MSVPCVQWQRPAVVKIGGSLFDLENLGPRLQSFLAGLNTSDVILVPGGGPTADLVRAWDRAFHLGEERAHWLALRALTFNAHFLASILPDAQVIHKLEDCDPLLARGAKAIMDMHAWALADESSPDHLPHTWSVTSDTLAARIAIRSGAAELILLKSVDFLGKNWQEAAAAGIVDPLFAEIMSRIGPGLQVRLVNFRRAGSRPGPSED